MSVIIIGGDMVDVTLVLAISQLSHETLPVHLIETSRPETDRHPGFDVRVIALAAGTYQQLARIDVWQAIADCTTVTKTAHVSDCGHVGSVALDAQEYRIPILGQAVKLYDVGLRLFTLLRRTPGATLHRPDRVAGVPCTQERAEVALGNGEMITGRLLVTTDDTCSVPTAACDIGWPQQPYEQLVVITSVTTSIPHDGRAFERFAQYDPLAMLPMSDGRCSLVWCHLLERCDEVTTWSDEQFCRELQTAFDWRLGHITQAGKRSAYPLSLTTALKAITHHTVLIGNAAQALYPIAGQGLNLGPRDVMSLAETLTRTQNSAEDVGDYTVPARYQQHRECDRETTIGVANNLMYLLTNHWAPLVVGYNAGSMAMELFTPTCDALAERILGWVTR